jgi:hypothetical protein
VSWWLEELERGAWYFDSNLRRWRVHPSLERPVLDRRLLA